VVTAPNVGRPPVTRDRKEPASGEISEGGV
jgi:hypothetical protein